MATPVVTGTAAGGDARGRARPARAAGSGPLSRHWYAWAMVLPVVVVTLALVGYPLVRGVFLSLTNATEANMGRTIGVNVIPSTYEFIGLKNYTSALASEEFHGRFIWTIIWTICCVGLHYL